MGRKAPLSGKRPSSLKPEKARRVIRQFHVLLKKQAAATADGKSAELPKIEKEIEKLGGLEKYQLASICGQSKQRGGDTSKLLIDWISKDTEAKRSLLEVGCLRVDNACARSNLFEPHVRIDLNSQHPQILKQDFMTMKREQKFDVISLSLVLNYVPDAEIRGKMLKRAYKFLNENGLLFFVLPRACIDNSRYCNEKVMSDIFAKIGFKVREERKTTKLVHWLLEKTSSGGNGKIVKRKVRDSKDMNNFCIVLK